MAITALEYLVFSSLRARNMLPPRPRVLELGQSNWYGDVSLEQLEVDIRRFVTDEARREALLAKLQNCISAGVRDRVYEIASIFWTVFADPLSYSAIDPGMPHSKYRFDLNQPVPLDEKFDVTVNIGTAEHVFNVYQFFKTSPGTSLNWSGISNPKLDALLDQTREVSSQAERKKLYSEVTKILQDELPMIFVVHPVEPKAFSPKVQGYDPVPDGMMRFKDVWLK